MTVGERIKKLRTEAGLPQSTLAKIAGCSAQVISNTERDYTKPTAEIVNRCAALFGVPADYILGRTSVDYAAVPDPSGATVFSEKIKDRMTQLQMSLSDLSDKSGITKDSCSSILAGTEIPSVDTIVNIAHALDTSTDYLSGKSEYCCAIASEDEYDIIMKYRGLSKKEKRIFLGLMESLEEK